MKNLLIKIKLWLITHNDIIQAWLYFIIFTTLIVTMLCGCKTTEKIEENNSTHDTVYIHKVEKDTLLQNTIDSIFIREYLNGDTVHVETYKYKDRIVYKTKEKVDTIYLSKTDTLYRQTEITKPDSKTFSMGWYSGIGVTVLIALLIIICYKVLKNCIGS